MQDSYLITGGAGFIGSHIVDALVARGDKVTVLDIKTQKEAVNIQHHGDALTYIEGDIRDIDLVSVLCKKHQYVVHLAAVVSVPLSIKDPLKSHDTNVNGALNVLDAAHKNGVRRVVYASSAAVYGNTEVVPVNEKNTLDPMSPYALHKLMNEQYAHYYSTSTSLETVGLRYFNVYGERQDPSSPYSGVISIFTEHAKNNTPPTIFGDGEQTRDFVHVSDVVSANLKALSMEGIDGGVYNIGTGTETSLNTLMQTFNEMSGNELEATYQERRVGDIVRSCSSIEKAISEIDYHPQCLLVDGLKTLIV